MGLADYTLSNTKMFTFEGRLMYVRVVDVYDGDTITAIAETTPGQYHQLKFRLVGIDTPEMRRKPGQSDEDADAEKVGAVSARNHVIEMILGSVVYNANREALAASNSRDLIRKLFEENVSIVEIECGDFDKYGRVLGKIYIYIDKSRVCINSDLIAGGYAVPYLV